MFGIDSFLRAIPEAAKSPYSLIAYAVSAVLFIVSATKLTQVKKKNTKLILAKIDSVNPSERKQVIDGILGTTLPAKLTGEQYLRGQRMRYVFLAFMGALVMVGTIAVIALINSSTSERQVQNHQPMKPPTPQNAKIRVQLWPRPEIKRRFLKDNDARLYLKTDSRQLDLTTFVPQQDFLDATTDIDSELIGKAVDLTIGPREKYSIGESRRRYLTPVVRLEVYPLGKKPVPTIAAIIQTPTGEKVFRTTDLPIIPETTAVDLNISGAGVGSFSNAIGFGCSHILNIRGNNLTVDTKLEVVDAMGNLVEGGWAGNEPGLANSKPTEVSQDGLSMKAYFAVPFEPTGQKWFLRLKNPYTNMAIANVPIRETESCPIP
jgi:hypothetical protein